MLSATPRTESAAAAMLLVADETSLTAWLMVEALTADRSVSIRATRSVQALSAPFQRLQHRVGAGDDGADAAGLGVQCVGEAGHAC